MKEDRSFRSGCSLGILSILLGFSLTLGTAFYQRPDDPACGGGLSAGFPLPFLCDEAGGSPISSWGRIDLFELLGTNPRVFLLDFLLISALLLLVWMVVRSLLRKRFAEEEQFRWAALLCIGYIVAFLFAFMAFQSGNLNFEKPFPRTPTPIIYTPTPFGTPALPQITPIPTTAS